MVKFINKINFTINNKNIIVKDDNIVGIYLIRVIVYYDNCNY